MEIKKCPFCGGIGDLTMDEKKRIKYIDTSKAVEITDIESLEQSKSDIWDMIREAQELGLKEGIKANSIVINKKFVKVPSIWLNICGSPHQLPLMICGLEVYFTDNELPENYSFAVIETPQTEREMLIVKTKSDTAREILTAIKEDKSGYWDSCDCGKEELHWRDKCVEDTLHMIAEKYGVDLGE